MGVNGKEPDTKRINAIKEWPAPQNTTEARQFIGLCGTVRIWISSYSRITSSKISTWKKGVEFAWTEDCQDAFNILKDLITTAPALLPINYTYERAIIISRFQLYGCRNDPNQTIWERQTLTIQIWSLPLTKVEATYSQPKLELYGLFCALRHFRLYICNQS